VLLASCIAQHSNMAASEGAATPVQAAS
jgi:hypothetical protein